MPCVSDAPLTINSSYDSLALLQSSTGELSGCTAERFGDLCVLCQAVRAQGWHWGPGVALGLRVLCAAGALGLLSLFAVSVSLGTQDSLLGSPQVSRMAARRCLCSCPLPAQPLPARGATALLSISVLLGGWQVPGPCPVPCSHCHPPRLLPVSVCLCGSICPPV